MNVAAQPVELRHDHWTLGFPRDADSGGKLWPAIERIGALPRLDLRKGFDDPPTLGFGEPPNGLVLGLQPEAGSALFLG
jgi:hypothetical protein